MLTAAVALGVAALALLSPLERKLRDQEVRDLVTSAVQSRSSFRDLDASDLRPRDAHLQQLVRRLVKATGARIALLDSHRRVLVDTDPDERDLYKDFGRALAGDRAVRRIVENGGSGEARVAVRVRVENRLLVLALRKPLNEQLAAVSAVKRAFTTAALAALAVAFIVAAAFASTLVRRLRRLRDAVVHFGATGELEALPDPKHRDEVGDLTRAFGDLRDRLARQEEIRRAFVATASHELRTPLTSLQGQLELLDEDLSRESADLEDARHQLAGARTQSERLARLAADLLELSRLDAELEMRREPVELAEVSRAVAAEFDARALAQETSLVLETAEPVPALADPGAVARVLRILVDNALRHSPRGHNVTVSVGSRDGAATVTVADSGPGVATDDRERIFERFARGRDAAPEAGFGLGLAIGRELAERMGGGLDLDGKATPGASFVLRLPASSADV